MKVWLLIAWGLMTVTSPAADWQQQLSAPEPGKFPPPRPVHATYGFGWSAVPAAEGSLDYSVRQPGQLRVEFNVRTTGMARSLFRLDARHIAIANLPALRPVSVRQTEAYKDETFSTNLDFTAEGLTRVRTSNVPKPGSGKPKLFVFKPLFDLHTALLWVRSQKLTAGDSYRLLIYPSTGAFLTEINVIGRETVKLSNSSPSAIKLEIKLRKVNKHLQVESYGKFKRATAWIGDDNDRLLLKVEAEIFIGSVWAELKNADFP